jgi:hypothetical protein
MLQLDGFEEEKKLRKELLLPASLLYETTGCPSSA